MRDQRVGSKERRGKDAKENLEVKDKRASLVQAVNGDTEVLEEGDSGSDITWTQ